MFLKVIINLNQIIILAYIIHPKKDIKAIEIGQYCFYIGTTLLSTTIFISGLFFLISLVISIISKKSYFKKDNWDLTLFIFSIILVLNSINISLIENNNSAYILLKDLFWDSSAVWIGLFNWIPYFLVFFGLQIYLKTEVQRIRFAKCLFIGIIPVILGLLLQKWFQITGPFIFLDGLIVFYLKPIEPLGGFAGIFNNPNYTGLWLACSLPFSYAILKNHKNKNIKLTFIVTIIITTIYCILSTNSRNSFLGIIISTVIMLGIKFLIITLLVFGFLYFLLLEIGTFPFLGSLGVEELLPKHIFNKLFQTNYLSNIQFPRIDIWSKTIKLIFEKPLLGWGAATFPILYSIRGGIQEAQHTHNMPLEIAQTNGIPAAIILTSFVTYLFLKAFKVVFIKNKNSESIINKAWTTSFLIIIISHITDVTYYEGRLSLLIWLLMAGLKCIIDEEKIEPSPNKSSSEIKFNY